MCEDELTTLAKTGRFEKVRSESGSFCYAVIRAIAHLSFADTQAIEGINSQIKLVSRRCPNISLELLSSRLLIKRTITSFGHGVGEKPLMLRKKWSMIKPFAEATVARLTEHSATSLAILADPERWSTTDASSFDINEDDSGGPALALRNTDVISLRAVLCDRALPESMDDSGVAGAIPSVSPAQIAWAKNFNVIWKRLTAPNKRQIKKIALEKRVPKASISIAILKQPSLADDMVRLYLVVEKFSHSVQFSRLSIHPQDSVLYVRWVYQENNCVESTLFFMSFYDACTRLGEDFNMQHCSIGSDLCQGIFSFPGVRLDLLMSSAVDILCLRRSGPPAGDKPKKRSGKGNGRGKGQQRKKKQPIKPIKNDGDGDLTGSETSGSECAASDVGNPGSLSDRLAAFLADELTWEDVSDVEGSDSDLEESDDDAGTRTAAVIKQAHDAGKAPSTEAVLEKAAELEAAGKSNSSIPEAELQEEALLLLIKQSREQRLELGTKSTSKNPTAASAKSAGAYVGKDVSAASDDIDGIDFFRLQSKKHSILIEKLLTHSNRGFARSALSWMLANWKTLTCMKAFADDKEKAIGYERSIALVLLKPVLEPVPNCRCLRCRTKDESQQLLYVHWLNNSDKCLGLFMSGALPREGGAPNSYITKDKESSSLPVRNVSVLFDSILLVLMSVGWFCRFLNQLWPWAVDAEVGGGGLQS